MNEMGLPTIDVVFKKLASTAVTRSTRGVLAVIVQDATAAFTSKTYTTLSDVVAADYTAENYAAISRVFAENPYKVIVVRVGTADDIDAATAILDTLTYNWVCAVPSAFQSGLVAHVKSKNLASKGHKVKALVCGVDAADDLHIVNVPNTAVTLKDGTELLINLYLPRLGGILAACPMTESVTYWELDDLRAVSAVADVGASIDAGNLALFKDDDTIRIARGVNTLTTISAAMTEDEKKITVMEGMDLIQEDIVATFKSRYLGKFKNKYDNQALLVSAILAYFAELGREDVLNPDYANTCGIDLTAQKAAWTAAGTDTSGWSDAQTKKRTYKSNVYLTADVQILDAMEDLTFTIYLS
jgi:phosphoribosylcarboxyaminoimidazole (NCAIR) mutase